MNRATRNAFTACAAVVLLAPLASLYAATPPLHDFSTIHADATGQRLQSAMIWADPSQNKPGVAIAFRKAFALPVKPAQAAIHLFADVRYVLWVNGAYVERGPNRFQPNGPEYDTVNLAPCLQSGRNAIAVVVVGNLSGGKVMRHAPGLTAQLEVEGKELFRTDATWKWIADTRFRQCSASWADLSDSLVDARVEDGDWTTAGYNDAAWKPAAGISGRAWGGLTARRIAPLREKPVALTLSHGATLPVTLKAGEKLAFETGRIVQAYPVIELDAEAGAEKRIRIEPHLGDLARAAGVVVTEFGPISVSWHKEGDSLRFQVTAAESAETTLALPSRAGRDSILLDGKMQTGRVQGSRLTVTLSPGAHAGSY